MCSIGNSMKNYWQDGDAGVTSRPGNPNEPRSSKERNALRFKLFRSGSLLSRIGKNNPTGWPMKATTGSGHAFAISVFLSPPISTPFFISHWSPHSAQARFATSQVQRGYLSSNPVSHSCLSVCR